MQLRRRVHEQIVKNCIAEDGEIRVRKRVRGGASSNKEKSVYQVGSAEAEAKLCKLAYGDITYQM